MKKRIFGWLLVLVMAISLFPIHAFAQEVTVYTGSDVHVNPLYDDGCAVQYQSPDYSSYTALVMPVDYSTYGTVESAATELREAMVNREATVTVQYKLPVSADRETQKEQIRQSYDVISDAAKEHTGVPNEGDYIKRHYGSWSASWSWTYSGGVANVTITYDLTYYTTAAQEAAVSQKVDQLLDEWDLDNASDYEKIATVYRYITDTVRYDYTHLGNSSYKLQFTTYAALINKTSVCQGYATLFYRLALELGVDCRYISGTGNGGAHGWNIVKLGEKYYNLDATWDEGESRYDWFLLSPSSFYDHYRKEEFDTADFHAKYPMATSDYSPAGSTLYIISQPIGTSVEEGETANVKVTASGEGLSYQWYYTSNGSTSTFYPSSNTTATYSTAMDANKNGRKIYCVITDRTGDKVTTNTVTLTARPSTKLAITAQPQNAYAKQGTTAKTTVKANGVGLKYQWYYTLNGNSTVFYKSSNTTATYSTTMDASKHGRYVYCLITDAYGNYVKSNIVWLRMAATVTVQPKNASVAIGGTVSTSVKAVGDGLKYQWYFTSNGATNTFMPSSNTTATYSTTMDASRAGRQVYCVVTDKYGNTAKSNVVTLGVPVKITTQPKTTYANSGATTKATVKATGDGLKYQWYYTSNGSSSSFMKSSNTAATYSTVMDASKSGRKVYCVITDKYGNQVTTNTVSLRLAVTITAQPKHASAAVGGKVSASVKAVGDGLKYQWYYTTDGSSATFKKSTNTTATYSTIMDSSKSGRKIYCVVTDKYGNTVKSNVVTLGIPVRVTAQPATTYANNGATAKATVKATGDGLKYQWYYTTNGSSGVFYKSSNTTATYSTTMDSSKSGRKVYCVITDQYGNQVTTKTVSLQLAVTITAQPTSVTVASGNTAKVSVTAVGDGLKYQWYYTANGSSSVFTKSSNTTATYSTIMDSSKDGRRVYCVITDKYGNSVKTATVTLSLVKISATFEIDVGWEYIDGYYSQSADITVYATGGTGSYQYKFEVFIDANSTTPVLTNSFRDSNYYGYCSEGGSILGTVLQITIKDSGGAAAVYRIDTVAKTVLSKKIL